MTGILNRDRHLQAKERGIRRKQIRQHLHLGLPASRATRKQTSVVPACGVLLWQPPENSYKG